MPILPANVLFRGVAVGPGFHRIELTYRVPGYLRDMATQLARLVSLAKPKEQPRGVRVEIEPELVHARDQLRRCGRASASALVR